MRTELILSFLRRKGYFTLQNNFHKTSNHYPKFSSCILWTTETWDPTPWAWTSVVPHMTQTWETGMEFLYLPAWKYIKPGKNSGQTGHKSRKGQRNPTASNLLYQSNPTTGPAWTLERGKFLWVTPGVLLWDCKERFVNSSDQRPNFFSNIFSYYNFHLEILLKTHYLLRSSLSDVTWIDLLDPFQIVILCRVRTQNY